MNSASMIDSLSGAMNGETTLVAMSDVPSGSWSISGFATSVNSSFWKNASGTKQMPIAMTERSSRFRSSRRCETSVPSASGSPSPVLWLISDRRVRWRRRRRCGMQDRGGLVRRHSGRGAGRYGGVGGKLRRRRSRIVVGRHRRGCRRVNGVGRSGRGRGRRVGERIEMGFLLELRAQLAGHRAGATGPASDVRRQLRQPLSVPAPAARCQRSARSR